MHVTFIANFALQLRGYNMRPIRAKSFHADMMAGSVGRSVQMQRVAGKAAFLLSRWIGSRFESWLRGVGP